MGIVSMTGFGRGEIKTADIAVSVEIKAVNHRYLDLSVKLPPAYTQFEPALTRIVRDKIRRGRVDIYVSRQELTAKPKSVVLDEQAVQAFLVAAERVLSGLGIQDRALTGQVLLSILQRRDVLDLAAPEINAEAELPCVQEALGLAVGALETMRTAEGAAISRDLSKRLEVIEGLASQILEKSQQSVAAQHERLKIKIDKLLAGIEIDPSRMVMEAAVLAERTDVSEEVVRLSSHLQQFRKIAEEPACGRKLDFLIQEMGREINTVGSKSQSSEISATVVDIKSEIEKIREQVQNIE